MRGFDGRAARVTWTVFLIVLLIATLYAIRGVLFIFIVALFFAYMLSPLVDVVDRYVPGRLSRILSLAIVYLILVGLLVSAGLFIGNRIVDEATMLGTRLPEIAKAEPLPPEWKVPAWLEGFRLRVLQTVREKFETGAEQMVPVFRKIGEQTLALLTNVGFAILIPILGFFFLKDGHRVRAAVLAQFAAGEQRALIEGILADVHVLLGQYIRALVILSLATFVFYAIYFEITGVPYAILLSGVAALLEFIPVIGPLSAAVITIVVALFSGYQHVLGLLMFFIAYRLFQDYVLQPFLFGAGVQLHPLLVIFGVLAGEEVAGVRGMFLSIPLLAILRVVYVRMQRSRLSQPEVVPTT